MTKTFLSLFILCFLFSCEQNNCSPSGSSASSNSASASCPAPDQSTPGQGSDPTPDPDTDTSTGDTGSETPSTNVPSEALTFDFNVTTYNMTDAQNAKIDAAKKLIKKVVSSEEFKDRVLNFTYNGKKQFVDNNGMTNAEIYQAILDGAETLYPAKNNKMDLEIELYYQATSTIGYTYPNVTKIWMNTKYFNNYTPVEVSDNLTHEWLHKLGFDHATSYSTSRDYSVPYGIGYLVEELAAKYQ